MSYCTVAEIEGANATRIPYAPTTKPTISQVEGFIDQIAGEIDARLAGIGVLLPVSIPASFLDFLKRANVYGAACQAEAAQFPENATSPDNPRFSPQGDRYYKWYQDMLKSISNRSAIPPDVPMSDTSLAHSYLTDNPDNLAWSDGSTYGQQPMFGSGRSGLKEF